MNISHEQRLLEKYRTREKKAELTEGVVLPISMFTPSCDRILIIWIKSTPWKDWENNVENNVVREKTFGRSLPKIS